MGESYTAPPVQFGPEDKVDPTKSQPDSVGPPPNEGDWHNVVFGGGLALEVYVDLENPQVRYLLLKLAAAEARNENLGRDLITLVAALTQAKARIAELEAAQAWRPIDEHCGVTFDDTVELLGVLKDCGAGYSFAPTHWRPRPDPPVDATQEDERPESPPECRPA